MKKIINCENLKSILSLNTYEALETFSTKETHNYKSSVVEINDPKTNKTIQKIRNIKQEETSLVGSSIQPISNVEDLKVGNKYEVLYGNNYNVKRDLLEQSNNRKLNDKEEYLKNNFDMINTIFQIQEVFEKSKEKGFENANFSINLEPSLITSSEFQSFLKDLQNFKEYKDFFKKLEFEILEKKLVNKNGKLLTNDEFKNDDEYKNEFKEFLNNIQNLGIKIGIDDVGQTNGNNTVDRIEIINELIDEVNKNKNIDEYLKITSIKFDMELVLGNYSFDKTGLGRIPKEMEEEYYQFPRKWKDLHETEIIHIQKHAKEKLDTIKDFINDKKTSENFKVVTEYVFNDKVLNYVLNDDKFKFVDMIQGNIVSEKNLIHEMNHDKINFINENNKDILEEILKSKNILKVQEKGNDIIKKAIKTLEEYKEVNFKQPAKKKHISKEDFDIDLKNKKTN